MTLNLPKIITHFKPFIITAFAMLGILWINLSYVPHNIGFINTHPHPYWAIIFFICITTPLWPSIGCYLLTASTYIFFVLLQNQVDGYIYFSTINLLQDFTEAFLFLLVGSILSERFYYIQTNIQGLKKDIEEEVALNQQNKNERKLQRKIHLTLEKQFLNQEATFNDLFIQLHQYKSLPIQDLIEKSLLLLESFFDIDHATFYTLKKKGSIEIKTQLGSIPNNHIDPHSDPLIQTCIQSQKVAAISQHITETNLDTTHHKSIIAYPIFNADQHIIAVISIEKMPFIKYTEKFIRLSAMILQWWNDIYNEKIYLTHLESYQLLNKESQLYAYPTFMYSLSNHITLSKTHDLPLHLIHFQLTPFQFDSSDNEALPLFAKLLSAHQEDSVSLFHGVIPHHFWMIITDSPKLPALTPKVMDTIQQEFKALTLHQHEQPLSLSIVQKTFQSQWDTTMYLNQF